MNEYEESLLKLSKKIPPEDTYATLLAFCNIMERIGDYLYEDHPRALIDLQEDPDIRSYLALAREINEVIIEES